MLLVRYSRLLLTLLSTVSGLLPSSPSSRHYTDRLSGRCFTVVPRSETPLGYYDMDLDEYPDRSKAEHQQNTLISTSHRVQVNPNNQ
jgi:hypothetical protein